MNSVLIAYDENYFEAGEVMLYSLSKNSTQSFKIHFFYHEMGDCSLKKMEQTIKKINSKTGKKNQLVLYDIGTLKWDLPVRGYWSIQTYFRLLAPEYIMEEKVLYLDPDIIVKEPIDELFEINMSNVGLVMCEDPDNFEHKCRLSIPDGYTYCNAGVMLMNLDYLRTVHFGDLISGWLKNNGIEKLNLQDQDIINGVGYQMMKYVDCNIYNCVPACVTNETKVIHYMFGGKRKPWLGYPSQWKVWWKYAKECEIENWYSRYRVMNMKYMIRCSVRFPYELLIKRFPAVREFRKSIYRRMHKS